MSSALPGRVLLVLAAVVVLASVIGGLLLIGSPGEQRLIRFDQKRERNLGTIARAVDQYWTRHESLPATLDDLAEEPGIRIPTQDPDTGEPYGYKSLGDDLFELCAVFSRKSPDPPDEVFHPTDRSWAHDSGLQCFELRARNLD